MLIKFVKQKILENEKEKQKENKVILKKLSDIISKGSSSSK